MPGADLGYDHSEIRVLAAAVGQREAARQLGMSENTVKSICYRAGDGETLAIAVAAKAEKSLHPNAPRAADILEKELREGARDTRVGLTRYAKRMAEQAAESGTLEEAPLYKAVADIHGKMHPTGNEISVKVQASSAPVIDIEAELIPDGSAEESKP